MVEGTGSRKSQRKPSVKRQVADNLRNTHGSLNSPLDIVGIKTDQEDKEPLQPKFE